MISISFIIAYFIKNLRISQLCYLLIEFRPTPTNGLHGFLKNSIALKLNYQALKEAENEFLVVCKQFWFIDKMKNNKGGRR